MATSLNDQSAANRLIEGEGRNFRWVPAYKSWWEANYREGGWTDQLAEVHLRECYVNQVAEDGAELTRREQFQLAARLSRSTQEAVLALAKADSRVIAEPSAIERHLAGEGPWEPPDALTRLGDSFFPGKPTLLRDYSMRARAHGVYGGGPRILLRSAWQATDPDCLHDVFAMALSWGNRVARLPVKTWRDWPLSLTPELAHRLWGCWVVFLDAPEFDPKRPFPQNALLRLLRPREEWLGHDRRWYTLPMPTHYVLGGTPVNMQNWSPELRATALETRPIFPDAEAQS